MELKRIIRVISDRWVVVLTGAVIGLLGAIAFMAFSTTGAEVFEATAALRFDPAEGQTAQALVDELTAARDFAVAVAEDQLIADPTSQISVDIAESKLLFIAQAPTEEAARAKAEALIDSYLQVDPEAGTPVDDQIANLMETAKVLDAQIAALQPSLTAEQQDLLDQQTQLDQTIADVDGRLRGIVLDQAAAQTSEEQNALAVEETRLRNSLSELKVERALLGEPPVAVLSSEDALLLAALIARKDLLNTEFQRLYLRKLGVAGRGIEEPIVFNDFSSEPIDPILLALLGLVGGALIAGFGLMMISRTRRIVWLPEDIEVPVLGQIPPRPVEAKGNEAWYDTTDLGPRKIAVQALRSSVQAYAHSGGTSIALSGHNIRSEEVFALAADLAGSMASAGDKVLLIDANFASRSALGEYRVSGMALSDVLRMSPTAPEFVASIDYAVDDAYVIRPGLAVIPSGPPPGSPADALAGRQFRSLIAAAEEKYDTTIVVVDDFGTPSSQVAMQRLRHGVLVTSPGSTTDAEVNGLLEDAERLRISVVGAVFLGTRRRLSGLFRKAPEESTPNAKPAGEQVDDQPAASPLNRLNSYAIPDERRTALVQHSPLGELANSFGVPDGEARPAGGLGTDLLDALSHASGDRAYGAVADYVVSRAEDMVTARYGYGDLLENLIHDVSENGFLPLMPIKTHRTVGEWLTAEIEREVEWNSSADVVSRLESLLAGGDDDGGSIDAWLDREFFRRHLERTDGEPEVWHLTSPGHAVSILVPARRMNAEKLESALTDIVSSLIDELERRRSNADARSDAATVAECEAQIADVRDFELKLRSVLYGDKSARSKRVRSVAWSPNWSAGTRANLATFQVHGLLPFEVLSEEEITALMATA